MEDKLQNLYAKYQDEEDVYLEYEELLQDIHFLLNVVNKLENDLLDSQRKIQQAYQSGHNDGGFYVKAMYNL